MSVRQMPKSQPIAKHCMTSKIEDLITFRLYKMQKIQAFAMKKSSLFDCFVHVDMTVSQRLHFRKNEYSFIQNHPHSFHLSGME